MLLKTKIEDLSVEDIKAFRNARKNIRESNHPYGDSSIMEMLLAGSEKLNQQFADSDEYKFDFGASE
ncbi:MAG: hypothetical protein LBK66_12345 [Spirochaetaceae bacterium]|jgi:hypothetical protein|nr:hypothetical protein [Spirochaetaceae bacterium]